MLAPIDKPRAVILCNVERTLLMRTCYAGMKPGRWYTYKRPDQIKKQKQHTDELGTQ